MRIQLSKSLDRVDEWTITFDNQTALAFKGANARDLAEQRFDELLALLSRIAGIKQQPAITEH